MSEINSTVPGGDHNTNYNKFGETYVPNIMSMSVNYNLYIIRYGPNLWRDIADGEKNMGYVDLDGQHCFNNGEPCFVMAREMTTVNTGCRNIDTGKGIRSPIV